MPQTFLQGLKLWAFQSAMGQGELTLNGGCQCPQCRLVVCRGGRCVEVRGPLLPSGCWRSGAKRSRQEVDQGLGVRGRDPSKDYQPAWGRAQEKR